MYPKGGLMYQIISGKLDVHGKRVLNYPDIQINNGLYILVGENGIGKSTFISKLYNLDIPSQVDEVEINEESRRATISYVTQDDFFLGELSALEIFTLIGNNDSILQEYAKRLECSELLTTKRKYHTLSGGEKQKIKLLSGLILDTPVLLIDEIDNNLDTESLLVVVDILRELRQKKTIFLISHNYEFYDHIADGYLTFNDETIDCITRNKLTNELTCNIDDKATDDINTNYSSLNKYYFQLKTLILITFVLFGIVLALYTMSFSFLTNLKLDNTISFKNNSAVILSPINSPFYDSLGEDNWFGTTPLLFDEKFASELRSKDYISKVDSIPNQQKASNYATYINNGKQYALEQTDYTIDLQNIPPEINTKLTENKISLNPSFNAEFYAQISRKEVFENTPNRDGELLLWGDYPDDETNQIMLPVDLVVYLIQDSGYKNVEEIIGSKIDIELNEVEGVHAVGTKDFTFEVSGIYYRPSGASQIIYAYSPNGQVAQANDCSLITNEAQLLSCQYSVAIAHYTDNQFSDLVDSKSLGRYSGFYVEVNSEADLKTLTTEIRAYDPYIYIDNDYVRTNEAVKTVYTSRFIKMLKYYIYFIIIEIIILYLILKYHFIQYRKVDNFINHFGLNSKDYQKFKRKNSYYTSLICSGLLAVSMLYVIIKYISDMLIFGLQINSIFMGFVTIVYFIFIAISNITIKIIRSKYE